MSESDRTLKRRLYDLSALYLQRETDATKKLKSNAFHFPGRASPGGAPQEHHRPGERR